MPEPITMRPETLKYLRRQLRFMAPDLDVRLNLPPGTIDAAEEGKAHLPPKAILELRALVTIAERTLAIPDRRHLGMVIRQARVALGLTQTQVADLAGMARTQYNKLEQQPSVTIPTLNKIAKAMGIPTVWILRGSTADEMAEDESSGGEE